MKIRKKNGIYYMTFDIFQGFPVVAAVSTRIGGVSAAPYDSLNMGFFCGDDPEAVVENRKRFCGALGIDAESLVGCRQVHSTYTEPVEIGDRGRGALTGKTAIPACDGLLTQVSGLPISLLFADCTPLLFYDPVREAVAIAHGGWRGTAGNIVGHTVARMMKFYGSSPGDILCAIGPAIGFECFEVGSEVIDTFRMIFNRRDLAELMTKKENGKYLFDLPLANRKLMEEAGILPNHIEDCRLCTYCQDDLFYSYRKAGGRTGRHMAVMMLK